MRETIRKVGYYVGYYLDSLFFLLAVLSTFAKVLIEMYGPPGHWTTVLGWLVPISLVLGFILRHRKIRGQRVNVSGATAIPMKYESIPTYYDLQRTYEQASEEEKPFLQARLDQMRKKGK